MNNMVEARGSDFGSEPEFDREGCVPETNTDEVEPHILAEMNTGGDEAEGVIIIPPGEALDNVSIEA